MYHRVNDDHPGDRMSVRPAAFAAQLEHLVRSRRPVLALQEAVDRLYGRGAPLPPDAVCLSFDDGYHDNLEHAAPALERFGYAATIFLVTGRMRATATIDRYEGCCDRDRALDWDEARELERRGHALGGHSRTHRELAFLDAPSVRDEVRGCRDDLAANLARPAPLFCYPRGSENELVRREVVDAGFTAAVTVYPGTNDSFTSPLLLRRTEISGDDDPADFPLKLAGAFDAWHRLWQRLRPRGA
jgi:peptidoglycan/xylan/chitin deacetylase (PgdA/CDA1 family)